MNLHDYFFCAGTGVFIVVAAIVMLRLNSIAATISQMRHDSARIADALEKRNESGA